MNKNKQALLHLSLISGVGPATIEKLFTHLPQEFDFYGARVSDLSLYGISSSIAKKIVEGLSDHTLLEQELQLMEKHNISWVSRYDDAYPEQLKHIHLPPVVLFYQGEPLWKTMQSVSLVGARKANYYGKAAVHKLVPGLVENNLYTVSGGAYGIDTCVHKETLLAGGKTVVVLGSGLLRPYPAENKKLFQEVLASGGMLISSFPSLVSAAQGNFPARNRIISGLSAMTIVVQAAQKSGSLITAHYALDQGKSVGAVPGSIDDFLSAGCHELLAQGAKIITKSQDILDEYTVVASFAQPVQMEIPQKPINEDPLVFACREPRGFEELIELLNIEENKLNERLFDLQLEGVLEQNFAGLWQKI